MPTLRRAVTAALALLAGAALAPGLLLPGYASTASAQSGPRPLVGTFRITAGQCAGGEVTGTYLRLVLPTGSENGPFVSNGDSRCDDETYTPLAPGADGGLVTDGYQPVPDPAFDGNGNGLADRITAPAMFFGVQFSTATNSVDPQTEADVPAPSISADGTNLTGQITAFAAQWNNQHFNQGAPKPGGGEPGLTSPPHGTYDPGTGAFTLDWASHIEGGPFNNFTGLWHLEGVFVPSEGGGGATRSRDSGATTRSTTVAHPNSNGDDDFTGRPPSDSTPSSSTTTTVGPTTATGDAPSIQHSVDGDDDFGHTSADEVAASTTGGDDGMPALAPVIAALAIVGVGGVGARYLLVRRGAS